MRIKVILCDLNPRMVAAWRKSFKNNPEVQIVHGSVLQQQADAWVSPTNARGSMDGGLDAAIKGKLGSRIEKRVKGKIRGQYGPMMPVGYATCVPTGGPQPRYLISTPTMVQSSENISHTMNVAQACAAAFQAVHMQNMLQEGAPIRSVVMPGLGAGTGQTPVKVCADLMWTAYDLFRWRQFRDFGDMRRSLESMLGDLGPNPTHDVKIAAGRMASKRGYGEPAPGVEFYSSAG